MVCTYTYEICTDVLAFKYLLKGFAFNLLEEILGQIFLMVGVAPCFHGVCLKLYDCC